MSILIGDRGGGKQRLGGGRELGRVSSGALACRFELLGRSGELNPVRQGWWKWASPSRLRFDGVFSRFLNGCRSHFISSYLGRELNALLNETFQSVILSTTQASALEIGTVIQELWSGYGHIVKIHLTGSPHRSVVVKLVRLPGEQQHPRGWNSDLSHERKVFSYQVEKEWYQGWSKRCDDRCRIPGFLAFERKGEEVLLVLEDLDAAGFPERYSKVGKVQIAACLKWLAAFHARFLGEQPSGLWETGTYWHLATRPDELAALDDEALRAAAGAIDQALNSARFQTFVHGDAKLANFCFSESGDEVAALDFQYVGGGCGMKDVAYFLGSCLDEEACEAHETEWLDFYFECLLEEIAQRQLDLPGGEVVQEWRDLFPVAWADFHRFLKGWCPGHWKLNSYSEKISRRVIERFG